MRLLKVLSVICLGMMVSGLGELNASATMRIIPEVYEEYIKYLQPENESKEEVKEEIVEDINEATYNPDNLRELSNLSKEQISRILEGNDLQVLADTYYEMENKYNINAIFLMALNMEESGHGRSSLAVYSNNLGGIKSRDGGYASFESWDQCLDYISNLIDEMYLTEGGAYYNGTSVYGVNVKYCVGGTWAENLNTIAGEILYKSEIVTADLIAENTEKNEAAKKEELVKKIDIKANESLNKVATKTNSVEHHNF